MNKKEVSEIRKNFSDKSGFFIMERILTGFVDSDKNVRCQAVHSCLTMPVGEHDLYEESLKKVLCTNTKAFTEYEFPNEAYEEGQPQDILYRLLKSELKDEEICGEFLAHIANNAVIETPFAVMTAYCSYTVRRKDKKDDFLEDDEIYRYILTAICPADTGKEGFIFDNDSNELFKKENIEFIVSKAPTDGFLYPVFSNRSTDVNHVMYYTKNIKEPNISVVENVLGCNFVMSAQSEKTAFQSILRGVVGDDLDYMVIKTVNEKIQEVVDENKDNTEKAVIDSGILKDMLTDMGIPQERIEMTEPVFEKVCGNAPLTASNLIDTKTVVASAGITVNIKPSAADKIRTSVIDGRKCLLIDIDDPTIEINGLPVNLE